MTRSVKTVTDLLTRLQSLDVGDFGEALCELDAAPAPRNEALSVWQKLAQRLDAPAAGYGGRAANSDVPADDDLPDFTASEPTATHAESAATPADGDAIVAALLDNLRAYQGLLQRFSQDFDEVFAQRARADAPEDSPDETLRRLQQAQAALVKYPVAAQAIFAALVREGRQYSQTPEGEKWQQRLASSAALGRARTLFEGLTQGMLTENGAGVPSAWVDGFLRALERGVEDTLADLSEDRSRVGG